MQIRRQLAPRCDVTTSQLDVVEAGPTSPVFFFGAKKAATDLRGFTRIRT